MRRRAFTLVEMLVVVAIIGILAALLLPALQRARAEARKVECQNHLKEIGHALAMYADQHKEFLPRGRLAGGYGPLAPLLPFLDNITLYNAINFSYPYYHAANETVVQTQMELFLCPSDEKVPLPAIPGFSPTGSWGRGNYVGNAGSGMTPNFDPSNLFYPGDGLFYSGEYTRANAALYNIPPLSAPTGQSQVQVASIRDGMENTIAYSETTMGHATPVYKTGGLANSAYNSMRSLFGYSSGVGADGVAGTADDGAYNCSQAVVQWTYGLKQSSWLGGSYGNGLYNHAKTPNAADIDCIAVVPAPINPAYPYSLLFNEPDADPFDLAPGSGTFYRYARGQYTARSLHNGGVNVLFIGGSVKFVNNTVDATAWRAASTRDSHEVQQSF